MQTKRFRSQPVILFIVIGLAFASVALSLAKGSAAISHQQFETIFLQLRLPRTVSAFVCGGLLALAGSLMQLLLKNPLADPYVLGVSSGATLATFIMMLAGMSEIWLIGGAWCGSLLTILLMISLARKHLWQTHTLLLTGIALACGFSAAISFILLSSPDSSLHGMLFKLMGDLNDARFPWAGLGILILGLIACLLLAPGLNIYGRGEKEASALGLSSKKYTIMLYLLSSLFTAAAVTLAGPIGFIGLIIPHLTRMLCGYDHRIMLPAAMLLGGSLLTIADTCARTLLAPQQIPVGILMALIGVPVFIWLLQK